ncbi:MAG: DNA-directed RNA polymerase subunit alpha [Planctomycetes bacterium GWA2_40_7]|nr:MAG: DNA-directed RNA polymerase subunit alpha [Planctomycetes bacterium GWA2_40_7]OHB47856.1 MAG: DNA-directed RNA polymerase subunit alpha [Planctomycetes bacterium GWF2_40_8]OHB90738.1 MAG: DNA-directed RNA polymerase subunit alpha [Planctomycetes bacterium RIFCSPHIGHO2_02_FULL_40_12]OHC02052.1 MAG: DNA-directed RNA polymerase subunit alpha [Planctomycetes bacterium RIFCSPLOWO2_12_FULL_40_19]
MRIRWREFELPNRVSIEKETHTDTYGKFIAEPFERGFGITIGNGLRRILLSSIEGSAVTSVKIGGVEHEFSTIPGVVEDTIDIILNIKNLVVKLHSDKPRKIRIEAKKKGEVTAGDIITDDSVDVINEDLHIATISENVNFNVEMDVKNGRGYKTAEENGVEGHEVGVIPVDAIFSPVRKTKIRVEETRVGRRTNYDRLIIEIWTNGILSPEMALTEASKVFRKHLNPFVRYFELGRELPQAGEKQIEKVRENEKDSEDEVNRKMAISVSELDLSVRASNCLEHANIKTIGELVTKEEDELLELKNFGKTTLVEIKKKLNQLGLSFKSTEDVSRAGREVSYEA